MVIAHDMSRGCNDMVAENVKPHMNFILHLQPAMTASVSGVCHNGMITHS